MVESRQCEVLAIVCTFTVVASFTVFLRIWSRYLGRNFSWDDWFILSAFVLLIGDTVATWMYIILSGTGYHVYDLPKKSVAEQLVALRYNFTAQMLYHPRTYFSAMQRVSGFR
jgi:structural maintenance of chromosome 2